ncbi:MAG: hypothetical protein IT323_15345 [Anaerolineae bacterium]|nr:hypothetical protein [Anaerolineae bacterium]
MTRTARLSLFILALVGVLILGALIVVLVLQRQESAPLPTVAVLPTEPPSATPSVTPTPTHTLTPTLTITSSLTPTLTLTATEPPAATPTTTAGVESRTPVVVNTNTPRPTSSATPTFIRSPGTPTQTFTPASTVTPSPLPSEAFTPTPTATFIPPVIDAGACISVVGDSVAAGEAVFEIPQTGFATVRSKPFSEALGEQFRALNLPVGPIHDRSAGAVALNSAKHPPYSESPAYDALLADECPYTVILPWVNDLSSGLEPAQAAPAYIEALQALIADLRQANPSGAILVLNYFPGAPAPFALSGHAPGFTADNVNAFNAALAEACSSGVFPSGVKCMDVNPAFATVATAYVLGTMKLVDFNAALTGVISGQDLLDYYATQTPDGALTGDGVHLSSLGKTLLAFAVIEELRGWGAFPPAE